MLRNLGYEAEVAEVIIGRDAKGRLVKGDGVGKNFAVRAERLIWDSRITNSYLHVHRGKASKNMYVVTDVNEKAKNRDKGELCSKLLQGRARFVAVVLNSHGGLGRGPWEWMLDAFQCKMDEAANEEVRQRLRLVMDTAMAEMACAVYQRNSIQPPAALWRVSS